MKAASIPSSIFQEVPRFRFSHILITRIIRHNQKSTHLLATLLGQNMDSWTQGSFKEDFLPLIKPYTIYDVKVSLKHKSIGTLFNFVYCIQSALIIEHF